MSENWTCHYLETTRVYLIAIKQIKDIDKPFAFLQRVYNGVLAFCDKKCFTFFVSDYLERVSFG